jgi:hypothetical protein
VRGEVITRGLRPSVITDSQDSLGGLFCIIVKYEIGVYIQTGDIVWANGPFKTGNWHDIMVYRSNLKGLLHPDKIVEADREYRGGATFRDPDAVLS